MARTIRNAVSVRTVPTVRRFRKALSRMVRAGNLKPRLVGSRDVGYHVAVVRGKSAIVVSPQFTFKGQAEAWAERKFGVAPPSRPLPFPS